MNEDKKLLIALIAVPLVMALIVFAMSKQRFASKLSPSEQSLLNFTHQSAVRIVDRKFAGDVKAIENPVKRAVVQEKSYPGVPLASMSPPSGEMPGSVSFIMVNPSRRMAIVDGKLVSEGEVVGQRRVMKIEEGKVLIQDRKGKVWLSLK